ncbi:hypothetical protein BCR34DRAFT_618166 [Clohesyomyces aquaticus]|uniref:Uncharacterized protein n=1 Tax=Clohesyomyces aquaticus TaxID=1231657 RepID=A0A1Y1YVJ1_9PLEO|nr:hypothetical protein BCR34DRAFT_618166 [Clohesyomyces aquaticus]
MADLPELTNADGTAIYRSILEEDECLNMLMVEMSFSTSACDKNPLDVEGMHEYVEPQAANRLHEYILQEHGFLDIDLGPDEEYFEPDMHPIFRRSSWAGVCFLDEVYEQMKPALTLVTKLITTKGLNGWRAHALYGTLEIDFSPGKRFFKENILETDLAQARLDVAAHWEMLSTNLVFYRLPQRSNDAKSTIHGCLCNFAWAALVDLSPAILLSRKAPPKHMFEPQIGLHVELIYLLLSPLNGLPTVPEPYAFLTDAMPQVGASLEFAIFGAKLSSSPFNMKVVGPLYARTWHVIHSYPYIDASVDADWLQAWFRKDTYARMDEVISDNLLEVPHPVGQPDWFRAIRYKNKGWHQIVYI